MLLKQHGDTDEAREALHKALETNGSVIRDPLIGTHTVENIGIGFLLACLAFLSVRWDES